MALWDWNDGSKWSFVIDTDSYAGNFEREICGYVCGVIDDAGSSNSLYDFYIDHYHKELPVNPFKGLIDFRVVDPGDDGIMRAPMDLAPTPGWAYDDHENRFRVTASMSKRLRKMAEAPAYNSVAIFLRRKPKEKELEILAKRARAFKHLPKTGSGTCGQRLKDYGLLMRNAS